MITPDYVRAMAAYNAIMNERFYAAAAQMGDDERRADRGAFWRSIHGTLSHILWGDTMWMSRFAGVPAPRNTLAESDREHPDFDDLCAARTQLDARLTSWAQDIDPAWLAGQQSWYSGAAYRQLTAPRVLLVTHLFNHQTHHRGQVHAMLTAAGQQTGATDLPFVLPAEMLAG